MKIQMISELISVKSGRQKTTSKINREIKIK